MKKLDKEQIEKVIATEVVARFITRNPHPKSKIYLQYEKQAFVDGAKWMHEKLTALESLGDEEKCKVCGNLFSDDKGNCIVCNPPIKTVQEF